MGACAVTRRPVEVWPPAAYIDEELAERATTRYDMLEAIGLPNRCHVLAVLEGQLMSERAARELARFFGTSVALWRSLDVVWWELRRKRAEKP